MRNYFAKIASPMKVSLQQLLGFRTATDQAARSRSVGVAHGPNKVLPERGTKPSETGPALTFKASSNFFLAEGFFITQAPLAGEYQLRAMRPVGVDLREIEIPRQMLAQLVQRLLQGPEESPDEAIARLWAMPIRGHETALTPAHVAGNVTFYNSERDHANIYAFLYKPDERFVEVSLYRTLPESVAPGSPCGELLPAFPFFCERTYISPLLEAAVQRFITHHTHQMRAGSDDIEPEVHGAFAKPLWSHQVVAAVVLGIASVLAVIWYVARA